MSKSRRRVVSWQPLLLVSVILIGAIMIWRMRAMRKVIAAPTPVVERPVKPQEPMKPLQPPAAMMPREARETFDKAVEVLTRVLLSPTMTEWEKSVRHPELTMPRLRSDEGRWRVLPALPLQIGPKFGITDALLVTTVKLKDGTHRSVAFERKEDRLLLDWESFTGWGEERIENIAGCDVETSFLVRVKVHAAAAIPPFEIKNGLSIVLSHPDGRRVVNAHVSEEALESSPAAQALKKAGEGLFTLRIRPHADSAQHGWVVVEDVVCTGWITDA